MHSRSKQTWTVLGIETSCDETAAAILQGQAGEPPAILAEVVRSQIDDHIAYGGVVPEIAARAHADLLDRAIAQTLKAATLTPDRLDGIAVTAGPGLIGGVLVGLMTGKALAMAWDLPL
ncbi:MAG: tRNA (adenosine(37)-N6)-threonylcarbamoyltransferase complex transferase subunit TsaD, partial [Pseudomonadota bacterium]